MLTSGRGCSFSLFDFALRCRATQISCTRLWAKMAVVENNCIKKLNMPDVQVNMLKRKSLLKNKNASLAKCIVCLFGYIERSQITRWPICRQSKEVVLAALDCWTPAAMEPLALKEPLVLKDMATWANKHGCAPEIYMTKTVCCCTQGKVGGSFVSEVCSS